MGQGTNDQFFLVAIQITDTDRDTGKMCLVEVCSASVLLV